LLVVTTVLFSQNGCGEDYANAYIVIADSSPVYHALKGKMVDLKEKLGIKMDSLGREYNENKDLIRLPENHEDELYAGVYYPRRGYTELLSLEYLDYYDPKLKEKTIGLIVGILNIESEAKKLLVRVKEVSPNAFLLNKNLYIGCMH
ncbi:MAG TPA: hypothetical protein DDZ39_05480, partial [Flavobacteriaceae bacterium]|nr:hypothetical protein [Flavobacteriaceae bacterium]